MKKVILILFLMFFTFSLFAEIPEIVNEQKISFQASPFLLGFYIFSILADDGEYAFPISFDILYTLNKYFILSIAPSFYIGNMEEFGYTLGQNSGRYILIGDKQLSISMSPGLLFKPFGTMIKGWYIGTDLGIGFNKNISTDEYSLILNISGNTGYTWVFRNGFTISLGGYISYGLSYGIAFNIFDLKMGYSF